MSFPYKTPAHLILDSRATAVFLSSVPLISQALEFVTHATAAGWYFTIPVPIFSFSLQAKNPQRETKALLENARTFRGQVMSLKYLSAQKRPFRHCMADSSITGKTSWEVPPGSKAYFSFVNNVEIKHPLSRNTLSWNQLETKWNFVLCTDLFYQLKTTCKQTRFPNPNASQTLSFCSSVKVPVMFSCDPTLTPALYAQGMASWGGFAPRLL